MQFSRHLHLGLPPEFEKEAVLCAWAHLFLWITFSPKQSICGAYCKTKKGVRMGLLAPAGLGKPLGGFLGGVWAGLGPQLGPGLGILRVWARLRSNLRASAYLGRDLRRGGSGARLGRSLHTSALDSFYTRRF